MTFSIRRALGVAVVAAVAGAAPLAAQGSPPPQVTVGGVVYTQYVYQLKDTLNHFNTFDITRAYVNVIGRFSGGVGTRVTGDIYRNPSDSSLSYRLKYAFATYTPQGSPLTFKVGQIHTPWLDWEEALWDYRVQGTMAMDRAGYLSAADLGVGVDGKWGPDKVNFQLTVVNGRFYSKPGTTEGKDAQARVSVRMLDTDDSSRVGGLRITGYAGYGRAPTGDRNRYIGMISYRSKQITLAGEAAATQDGQLGATNGHVYSAFGVYKFPQTKAAVIARVDVTHKQSGAVDKQTRFIGGVSYQLTPNWRLLGDWDYANYQTDALNTAIKGNVLHIPTVLGGDVPTYNLPDVKETLRFTPEVLADIFLGKITKWSDARIASANPGLKLPDADIVVVHRSDGSGTSFIWTDYLSKVSAEWEQKVGRGTSVNWPVGLGGKGNEGVTATVKQTPGAIG